ncbi:SRPBCC family protein [Nocardioides anomalus]|uniref:SRPBCC family protein n=1 Tax=Nocardioides anomalus TaxID=2712223 RepID=A0A6G6WGY1_9ACTN|nr:SRPBCC family protein [Nocardioides anomalus]QIG44469.1 SRPBCC family protein [Nocardioides anomalus]
MDLSHRFTVPTPVEETWAHFQDIASVAECFPGATVTEATEQTFAGSVKVKLGPIALVYNGSGTFVEKDEAAHRFVVDAKGKDKRGNGTAGAKVTLAMESSASGGTDVQVDTDLAITGKPAQFGRGVMQDVSDKLLGQFVACLEQRLGSSSDSSDDDAAAAAGGAHKADAGAETAPSADPVSAPEDPAPAPAAAGAGSASTPHSAPPAAPRPLRSTPPPASSDDSLNLGAAVLPVLAKSYWKQGLGALVVVALLVRWLRRG